MVKVVIYKPNCVNELQIVSHYNYADMIISYEECLMIIHKVFFKKKVCFCIFLLRDTNTSGWVVVVTYAYHTKQRFNKTLEISKLQFSSFWLFWSLLLVLYIAVMVCTYHYGCVKEIYEENMLFLGLLSWTSQWWYKLIKGSTVKKKKKHIYSSKDITEAIIRCQRSLRVWEVR